MTVPADQWLNLFSAAQEFGCSRATLLAAVKRGELPGYCGRCHTKLSRLALEHGHLCRLAPNASPRYPLALRRRDVKRFSVSPSHRAAGLASAKARKRAAR